MPSPLPRRSGWAYGSLGNPDVSAFPERVIGSACASSFSRLARRSLALRPAHSRCHQFVTRYPKASAISFPPQLLRLLPAGAVCRVGLAPPGKRRLATAHAKSGHSPVLFDPLLGDSEEVRRNRETERLRGLEVDRQHEPGRLHDRQVGRLLALENPAGVEADQASRFSDI